MDVGRESPDSWSHMKSLQQPYLEIIEQPARSVRYQYHRMGQNAGHRIEGENGHRVSDQEELLCPSYPTVRLRNFEGDSATVAVSLICATDPVRPHSHHLTGASSTPSGQCVAVIDSSTNWTASFPDMGVLRVGRKHSVPVLIERYALAMAGVQDPLFLLNDEPESGEVLPGGKAALGELPKPSVARIVELAESEAPEMDANSVRLCFQAFMNMPNGGCIPLERCVSREVVNRRQTFADMLASQEELDSQCPSPALSSPSACTSERDLVCGDIPSPRSLLDGISEPRLIVVEQPMAHGCQFRFPHDGPAECPVLGQNLSDGRHTYPTVVLQGCPTRRALVMARTVNADAPQVLHPTYLEGDHVFSGQCYRPVDGHSAWAASFPNLNICRTGRKRATRFLLELDCIVQQMMCGKQGERLEDEEPGDGELAPGGLVAALEVGASMPVGIQCMMRHLARQNAKMADPNRLRLLFVALVWDTSMAGFKCIASAVSDVIHSN